MSAIGPVGRAHWAVKHDGEMRNRRFRLREEYGCSGKNRFPASRNRSITRANFAASDRIEPVGGLVENPINSGGVGH